jgi:hypothetical protein
MSSKEADPQLVNDLLFYYEEKKRISTKHFKYTPSEKYDQYFKEAALLCEELSLHPAQFVQYMYDRMHDKKNFFSPMHLRGQGVRQYSEDMSENSGSYEVCVTNATIEYADVWAQQLDLAMRFIRRGEPVEEVLLDSGLKFFAWFRILATPDRSPKIIDKYKKIAKKELTPGLKAFILSEKLDIDRLS